MERSEERRFVHGLEWGAVATAAMGATTVLMIGIGVWPLARPLSMAVAEEFLPGASLGWALAAVVAVQLCYGAFCGGMLSVLAEPVTMGSAIGLGLLRWFTTQVLVLPAMGWSEFGLRNTPLLAVATLVPHLVYALTVGWLMRREEEAAEPIPLFAAHWHWPGRLRWRH